MPIDPRLTDNWQMPRKGQQPKNRITIINQGGGGLGSSLKIPAPPRNGTYILMAVNGVIVWRNEDPESSEVGNAIVGQSRVG